MAKLKGIPTDPAELEYTKQLERWGIDRDRAKELGLVLIKGDQLDKLHIPMVSTDTGMVDCREFVIAAIAIPYFDYDGSMRTDPSLTQSEFCVRYRYLTGPNQFGQTAPSEFGKYYQEGGTVPWAYIPRMEGWEEYIVDTKKVLIITEGEMKAAKAAEHDLACIALGGVHSFKSIKHGISFLPELRKVDWKKRDVMIAFDGDVTRNINVRAALNELAEQLYILGARVYVVDLPSTVKHSETGDDIDHAGLDDFIVHAGYDAFVERMEQALPYSNVDPLYKLSDRYAYVSTLNNLYDFDTDNLIGATAISNNFGSEEYHSIQFTVDPQGELRRKMTRANLGTIWMTWPQRNNVHDLTYEPGGEKVIVEDGQRLANVWQGWGTVPKKGKFKPFVEFVEYMLMNEPQHAEWFLRWCAYPIQNPGAKLYSAVVMHGAQGTGKTLMATILGEIYGKNFLTIGQRHLQSDFNGWMHGKQLILGDEISGTGSAEHRKNADTLKGYITDESVTINRKNKEAYELPNHCNFFFTSNHPDAFFLEDDDRRFFICEAPSKTDRRDTSYYSELVAWLEDGGYENVHHYLENLDLKDFDAKSDAPRTMAKESMIESSRSDLGAWLKDTLFSGPVVFGGIELKSELFAPGQLKSWYETETGHKIKGNQLGFEMKRLGAKQAAAGGQIRLKAGSGKTRLWAVKNVTKWENASTVEAQAHFEKEFVSNLQMPETS